MDTGLLKDILYAIFVLPLTAGRKTKNPKNADCKISSTIITVNWLSVMLVLIPGLYQTNKRYDITSTPFIVHIALDCNLLLGIIGCIALFLNVKTNATNSSSVGYNENAVLKLRMFFLWIFLLGVLIDSGFEIWQHTICFHHSEVNNTMVNFKVASKISYDIFLCIFCVLEMVCFSVVAGLQLKKTPAIQFAMITMMAGNISIWVNKFNILYQNEVHNGSDKVKYNCSANASEMKDKEIANISHEIKPALHSTVIQFVFLSLYSLIEHWANLDTREDILQNVSSNECNTKHEDSVGYDTGNVEEMTPLIRSDSFDDVIIRINENTYNCSYIGIVSGVVLVVVLICMCVFGVTIFSEDKDFQYWFGMLICIYKVIMTVVFYVSFFCVKNNLTENRGYNTREILLIIGVFFNYQYITYQVIAGFMVNELPVDKIMECLFNYIFEYLQIVCILQLNLMGFQYRTMHRKTKWLKACVGFSMAIILGFWFYDCFFPMGRYHVSNNIYSVVQKGIGEEAYHLIKFLIAPMFMFYRFSVFFAYANLYQHM